MEFVESIMSDYISLSRKQLFLLSNIAAGEQTLFENKC